ncbi:MAG: gamma-glutamyltransferase family protein, partial [Bacteroidota bacterium]|nr:gamma-glutamyltransferase family protein [Bacteroidota bacterium]
YKGEVGKLIVAEMEKQGGLISMQDLENYSAKWRTPITGAYKNYRIISMGPPSSGGIALLQLLKGIEGHPIKRFGHNTRETIHIMTELERRVYVDRTTHLGDPDYVQVPKDKLLNEDYLKNRFHDINMKKATPSSEIKEGYVERIETIETTHYSIVDTQKNAVSITTTLNGNFGSKVVVEGAGFFLNNNMDDFTAKPGHANMFGLVGGIPNIIEPGKRMLSSMTPTILEKEGNLFMVLGTPGGSTIITSVFQTILNVIEHNMGMQEAINAKKVHHQWLPDHILAETGAIDSLIHEDLNEMGHKIVPVEKIGRIEGILIKPDGSIEAGADYTRGDDTALAY